MLLVSSEGHSSRLWIPDEAAVDGIFYEKKNPWGKAKNGKNTGAVFPGNDSKFINLLL